LWCRGLIIPKFLDTFMQLLMPTGTLFFDNFQEFGSKIN